MHEWGITLQVGKILSKGLAWTHLGNRDKSDKLMGKGVDIMPDRAGSR